ncbi:hypothetical protein D3P09_12660 [Paenibacillus pinisoli]|uniref:Uncharacterized protein n=1 Tax=Paenibacillus pinisoli TaxID=1276110 RepID=A0A3A6PXW6_9BACL|nr:hypothetical protein [Paenibacillus pinisoli]RJX40203.1 hypothetical protein D3P09_12660 [Paenibacillus pinisoli]
MKKVALLMLSATVALTVSAASASAATNPHHKAREHKMHAAEHKVKAHEHKLHAKQHKAREHKLHAKGLRPYALPETGNGGMSK